MTFRAVFQDGRVVLPEAADIPEGSRLDIRVVRQGRVAKPSKPKKKVRTSKRNPAPPPTLNDCFRSVIGKATGLPPDASRNIDHYLYGGPKR